MAKPFAHHKDDKADVRTWAKTVCREGFIVFDTETTGLGPDSEIIQFSATSNEGDEFNQLIHPQGLIFEEASRVHGITMDDLRGAPAFPEVYPLLANILSYKPHVIAYNIMFDLKMLAQVCQRHALPPIPNGQAVVHCAMTRYAAYYGDWNSYRKSYTWVKLTAACETMGVAVMDAHDALGDVRMTKALIERLAE